MSLPSCLSTMVASSPASSLASSSASSPSSSSCSDSSPSGASSSSDSSPSTSSDLSIKPPSSESDDALSAGCISASPAMLYASVGWIKTQASGNRVCIFAWQGSAQPKQLRRQENQSVARRIPCCVSSYN